ncbi:MAG: Restriction endonuclease fold toxin 7, partial [Hyphomicrobiales bacterium]
RIRGLFDDIVPPAGAPASDMPTDGRPDGGNFRVARNAMKVAPKSALPDAVPWRVRSPDLIDTASELMAAGMAADDAPGRAAVRFDDEGALAAGRIGDVVGQDDLADIQRAPASPNLAWPAVDVGEEVAGARGQAPPDDGHASGDSALQSDGRSAAGEALGSADAAAVQARAQPGLEPASAIAQVEGPSGEPKSGKDDPSVVSTDGRQSAGNDPLHRIDRFGQAADSPKDNSGGADDGGLLQDLVNYASRSIEALSRIPGGLARLAEEFKAGPVDTISRVANSFPQTRVEGELLAGTTSIFATILANAKQGRAFETAALQALQLAKNKTMVPVPGVGRSIPDSLIRGVTEIKSGLEIDNSLQLIVHAAHARSQNIPFNLVVAPTTQRISKAVRDAVRLSGGTIQRFDSTTGKFGPFP